MKDNALSMRRRATAFFAILLAFAGILFALPGIATAADETINVPADQPTIAAAVNAIKAATVTEETNYTVSVAPGMYSDQVQVVQEENKNIVIKATGPGVILTNNITLTGQNRWYDTESFTLEGVKFNFPAPGSAAVSCIITTSDVAHGYIHNITIKNCEFTGNSNTVGMTVTSAGTGECNVLTLENCTATDIHSLLQATGGTRDITVTGCTVTNQTGGRGVNALANGPTIISNCVFDVAGGYALRFGNGTQEFAPLGPDDSVTVTNCFLGSGGTAADEGTVVIRGNAPKNITISNSSIVNKSDGFEFRNINIAHGDEFNLVFNDNYWGLRGCSPAIFTGLSTTQLDKIVSRYYIKASFDANGGVFSDSSTVIPAGTAKVPTTANLADFVAIDIVDGMTTGHREATFPTPKWSTRPFLGFFTAATAGDQVSAPAWGKRIENLIGDDDLYAHWGELQPILVTFDAQNGSQDTTVSVLPGNKVSAPSPQPTRTGYTFAGWWTDPTGGTLWDFNTSAEETMTLYAHWTKGVTPPPPTPPSDDDTETVIPDDNVTTGDPTSFFAPIVMTAAAAVGLGEWARAKNARKRSEGSAKISRREL